MATTNTRYVDVDAAVGGDGTTNGLSGGTCAYKSLSIWEAARQADLPTGDIIEEVICGSNHASTHTADTTKCTINGWTTDSTRYISIRADDTSRAGTSWSDSKYRITVTSDTCIHPFENDVRISRLQLSSTTYGAIYPETSAPAILIDSCFIKSNADGVFVSAGSSGTVTIRNCILVGSGTGYGQNGIESLSGLTVNVVVQNCTIIGFYIGVAPNSGTFTATNVLAKSAASGYTFYQYGGTLSTSYCASDDAHADDYGATGARNSQTFTFVGADDYALASNDAGAKNYGTDLSATFTTDIVGTTRPTGANTWDIGAFEYVSAASPSGYMRLGKYWW